MRLVGILTEHYLIEKGAKCFKLAIREEFRYCNKLNSLEEGYNPFLLRKKELTFESHSCERIFIY